MVIIFIGKSKPLTDRSMNILENINETIICSLGIIYVTFTDYCPDTKVQYGYGWMFDFILTTGNIGYIVYHVWLVLRYIRLIIIKYYRRVKKNFRSTFSRTEFKKLQPLREI